MTSFTGPVDIVNRALQHCGAPRIWQLSDATPQAQELAFAYDKVRRAELRRNPWRFSLKRTGLTPIDTTTYRFIPGVWSSTNTYLRGYPVQYTGADGTTNVWVSKIQPNINLPPDQNLNAWAPYFGTKNVDLWNVSQANPGVPNTVNTGYWTGQIVYTQGDNGYSLMLSLADNNQDIPSVYPVWVAGTVYNYGDTVCLASVPQTFNGAQMFGPTGLPLYFYTSLWQCSQDLVRSNNPPGTDTRWIAMPPNVTGSTMTGQNWLMLPDATLARLRVLYPAGAGPLSDSVSRNLYQLPNGYLRTAPQMGGTHTPYVGAPGFIYQGDDWEFTDEYFSSWINSVIKFRFAADIQYVPDMDDMFCEGLGASLALEIAPMVTDRAIDRAAIVQAYTKTMREARIVNAIEQGPIQQQDNQWIAVRY